MQLGKRIQQPLDGIGQRNGRGRVGQEQAGADNHRHNAQKNEQSMVQSLLVNLDEMPVKQRVGARIRNPEDIQHRRERHDENQRAHAAQNDLQRNTTEENQRNRRRDQQDKGKKIHAQEGSHDKSDRA